MKPIIFTLLLLPFFIIIVDAQGGEPLTQLKNNAPLCQLPPAPFKGHIYIPSPFKMWELKKDKFATFNVDQVPDQQTLAGYICEDWPADAIVAFDYAANIWGGLITSSQVIHVQACWTTGLPANTLGSAGTYYYSGGSLPAGAGVPLPLAESMLNNDLNSSGAPFYEIYAIFNGSRSDWYFGTDGNVAPSQIDFATTVLHELGHGLGFSGRTRLDDGTGVDECAGIAGEACHGYTGVDFVYTQDVITDNGVAVTSITNPSTDLAALFQGGSLSGGSGGLFLNGPLTVAANGAPAQIYTPSTYQQGSTFSHFNTSTFQGEVMKHALNSGQAIHDPGLALDVLNDFGWGTVVLPVELVTFEVKAKADVHINWMTKNEINNRGFSVQHSVDGSHWSEIAFIDAQSLDGTKDSYEYSYIHDSYVDGNNYYRLAQKDWDGEEWHSVVRQVYINKINENDVAVYPTIVSTDIIIHTRGSVSNIEYNIYNELGLLVKKGKSIGRNKHEISVTGIPNGYYYLLVSCENKQPLSYSFVKN